jgi:endonuclease G
MDLRKQIEKFLEDKLVKTGSAVTKDYAKSGYDRGHPARAADLGWSAQTMRESFYFSNMSPQLPAFNRGIWKKMEEKVRDWALTYDTIFIVTGVRCLSLDCQPISHRNINQTWRIRKAL